MLAGSCICLGLVLTDNHIFEPSSVDIRIDTRFSASTPVPLKTKITLETDVTTLFLIWDYFHVSRSIAIGAMDGTAYISQNLWRE